MANERRGGVGQDGWVRPKPAVRGGTYECATHFSEVDNSHESVTAVRATSAFCSRFSSSGLVVFHGGWDVCRLCRVCRAGCQGGEREREQGTAGRGGVRVWRRLFVFFCFVLSKLRVIVNEEILCLTAVTVG